MQDIIIRKVMNQDLSQINELQKAWFSEKITHGYNAPNEFVDTQKNICFIAEINKTIIGFVFGKICIANDICIYEDNEQYLEIEELYVSDQFRNQEIGKKLFENIEKEVNCRGIKHIYIYSATKDINRIINFYTNMGMKSWNIQMYK